MPGSRGWVGAGKSDGVLPLPVSGSALGPGPDVEWNRLRRKTDPESSG